MPRTMIGLLRAVAVLLLIRPCVAQNIAGASAPLGGTAWRLASLAERPLAPGPPVTLNFGEDRVHGSDGCNRYSAPCTLDSESFQLTGAVVSTKMACAAPVMEQGDAFITALTSARAVRVDGGQLSLLGADGAFLAKFTAQTRKLAGAPWRVVGYNNGRQAVVSVRGDSTITMVFADDGVLAGSAGCNTYTAEYGASGKSVTISKAAATGKMCAQPEGVMEQEAAFLAALEKVAVALIDGDRLELRSSYGALQVSADRMPGAEPNRIPPTTASASQATFGAHGLRLPATFRGELPCADCEAIRHHLDLWPDQVFHLRREWVGRDFVRDDIGRWRVDPSRRALVLQGGAEAPLQLEIKGADRLRLLDLTGKPIASSSPYTLASDGVLTPTDVSLLLGGEMRYLADAARFTECLTGRSHPIAQEGDFVALQRAYLEAVGEPGALLYVTFDGSIEDRPKMDGAGLERTVIVRRFINVWPGRKCERAKVDASLTNTYWRVVSLGDEPVQAAPDRREPYLLLRGEVERSRFSATVGCNQILGGYNLDGESIRISPMASTSMACPPPLAQVERKLREALGRASRWRIQGATLDLLDEAGAAVAHFEAVYFW